MKDSRDAFTALVDLAVYGTVDNRDAIGWLSKIQQAVTGEAKPVRPRATCCAIAEMINVAKSRDDGSIDVFALRNLAKTLGAQSDDTCRWAAQIIRQSLPPEVTGDDSR